MLKFAVTIQFRVIIHLTASLPFLSDTFRFIAESFSHGDYSMSYDKNSWLGNCEQMGLYFRDLFNPVCNQEWLFIYAFICFY